MTDEIDTKDPKFLAFWTKCIRETSKWSQEALAVAAGLDVRTIQRIEAGYSMSTTTRRALARGLGYDNPDVFEDPEFIKGVHTLLSGIRKLQDEEVQKQFPDHVRVSVLRVRNGEGLACISYDSNAYVFQADEAITEDAKDIAAIIFDFLRDLDDLGDAGSFSERLSYQRSLGEFLVQLEALGAACYRASRTTTIAGTTWVDKTPVPIKIGYLTVVPVEKILTEMMVPRRLS